MQVKGDLLEAILTEGSANYSSARRQRDG
jgi:hypothetical protein